MPAASQMGGPLPDAIVSGRSTIAGPQTGGYISFGLSGYSEAAGTQTDLIAYAIEMPFDFRIEAIVWGCFNMDVSASFQVAVNSTVLWDSSETDLLSADVTLTDDSSDALLAVGTTPTLVAAERNLTKGDILMIGVTDGGAGAIDLLTVQIIGYPRGHVNVDPADD